MPIQKQRVSPPRTWVRSSVNSLRLRWYALSLTRATLRNLGGSIAQVEYTPKRGHGFVLDEVRPNYLVGSHVERTEREFITRDPFGEESRQTVTVYVHTKFRLSTDAPGLEVVDPPRSVQFMISQLAVMTDFTLTVSPITVDPLKWVESIESEGVTGVVRRLEYSDIVFGARTRGALRLDGDTDVRAAGVKILGKRERFVRRVTAQIQRGPGEGSCWSAIVERDAKAVIHAVDAEDARGLLRSALVRTLA